LDIPDDKHITVKTVAAAKKAYKKMGIFMDADMT
jgi:hypothetical protein